MTITNCPMCSWEIPELSEPIRTCLECGADLTRWTPKKKEPPVIPVQKKSSDGSPFARQAATFSLAVPFVVIALHWFTWDIVHRNPIARVIVGCTADILIVSGFILGVIALLRTRKCGREGIFGKAIAGVCLNGLVIAVLLIAFHVITKNYIERTNDRQRQRTIQRPW